MRKSNFILFLLAIFSITLNAECKSLLTSEQESYMQNAQTTMSLLNYVNRQIASNGGFLPYINAQMRNKIKNTGLALAGKNNPDGYYLLGILNYFEKTSLPAVRLGKSYLNKAIQLYNFKTGLSEEEMVCAMLANDFMRKPGAVGWAKRLADRGNADGEVNLAGYYFGGFFVEKNLDNYVALSRMAARQGSALGLGKLGTAYIGGLGVEKDYDKGISYYKEAALNGSELAKYNLFSLYIAGVVVPKDRNKAFTYLQALSNNSPWKDFALAQWYDTGIRKPENTALAIRYYKRVARRMPGAQLILGAYFFNQCNKGINRQKNRLEAIKWLKLASVNQVPDAQGLLYRAEHQ